MKEIVIIFITSCIPAIISGIVTYLVTNKKAKSEISKLQTSNKHEIEKLIKQHEVDIDSLKEKHQFDIQKSEIEHNHKIELLMLNHKQEIERKESEQTNEAMFALLKDLITNPNKLNCLLEFANDPRVKNKN